MPARHLPARPNLEQYKKQAKDLLNGCTSGDPEALRRMREYRRGTDRTSDSTRVGKVMLADAQFVIAREHGFESWPKFAGHIETLPLIRSVASLTDPVAAFIEAACAPRTSHGSGTLEHAELILAQYPHVAGSNIHIAAILIVHRFPNVATRKPSTWDAQRHGSERA